jgi:hypothetical protein
MTCMGTKILELMAAVDAWIEEPVEILKSLS